MAQIDAGIASSITVSDSGCKARLPKEFHFEGTEVRVSKVGGKVILEPLARTETEIAAVWAEIDALRKGEDLFAEGGFDDPPVKPDPGKFLD